MWHHKVVNKHLINISRSKGNHPMDFGQLTEYNMRSIFLEKSYPNGVEKLFPDSFLKNQNWAYLWINCLKFYTVCFYCMPSEDYRNILKLNWGPLAFTSYIKFFLKKNKKRSRTSLPASFSTWILKKNIFFYILLS